MKTRKVSKRGRGLITNPERICFVCKQPITHRALNAKYCEKCSEIVREIRQTILATKSRMKKKHKKTRIELRIKIRRIR